MNELTDEEKSAMLAKAMGQAPEHEQLVPDWAIEVPGIVRAGSRDLEGIVFNFYNPDNMALAKRTIAWGYINNKAYREWLDKPHQATGILVGEDGIKLALDTLLELEAEDDHNDA